MNSISRQFKIEWRSTVGLISQKIQKKGLRSGIGLCTMILEGKRRRKEKMNGLRRKERSRIRLLK
jgi:hypothetical protein